MKKSYDVAVVGEVFTDHIFSGFDTWPIPGVELFTNNYAREVGGGAANTASGLARLKRKTLLFGVAGIADQPWLQSRFAAVGIRLDGMKYVQEATGVTVSISTKADRTFFTYPGANVLLPQYIASQEMICRLSESRHVHFAMPLPRETARSLLPELKGAGCTLSLDVGWQLEWLKDKRNVATCAACDYFLPNLKEAQVFTGADTASAILRVCANAGIPSVVLKLGAEGAAVLWEGREFYSPSYPVEVIDTTGAGDAFNAGWIDALLDAIPVSEMLRRACICGALSTRAMGALQGLATREDIKEVKGFNDHGREQQS